MSDFKTIVVGAGIEGSATAYYLAKNGRNTLLLEQYPLPHSRGSSHGQSRIIRRAYSEDYFSSLMNSAYARWHQLERESQTRLIDQTGYIMLEKAPYKGIALNVANLQRIGAKVEQFSAAECRAKFAMPECPDGYRALYEPGGGGVRADKCLLAFQKMFVTFGGTIKDGEKVLEIVPGETVTVKTNKATYRTSAIVITAGPWTSRLTVPLGLNLPLQPIRIDVCYWKTNTDAYKAENSQPTFVLANVVTKPDGSKKTVYGVPALEYPGHIKVCLHDGPEIDPELRDLSEDNTSVPALTHVMKTFFPLAELAPSIRESCIYTMTPDKTCILDKHPKLPNIVIGAGFSGTGFKLAPVVGEILGDMVLGRQPSYDISAFRMNRFPGVVKSSSRL